MKNMFTKRNYVVLFVMTIMVTVLVACSSSSGGPSTDSGKTTEGEWSGQKIKVQMIGDFGMESSTDPITGEKTQGLTVLKEEFEKQHPGAKVEFILMPWEGYTEKTQSMITSGEADVYQMPGVTDYAPQGVLEPLQSYIDEDEEFDLDIFIDNQVDGWKALGPDSNELEIWGLPFLGDARFIAFDKELFDQWGVEYLSEYPTMEEITEKAKQMTGTNPETGEQNYGIWFRGDYDSAFRLINTAEGQNGQWGTGFAWDEIEFEFDSPEMLNGLNWLLDMQEYAPKGIVSNQGNEKWLTKDNNIAIMLNQGPGNLVKQAYAQGLEDRIGIVQEFKNEDGKGGLFAGSPITIAKDSKNKELAWEWLKFATSDFTQKYIFEEVGAMPAVKSANEWESVKEKDTLMLPTLEAMSTPWTPRYPWGSSQPRYILSSEIEAALTGERSAEKALEKAQKESTEWLKNR
ncbi:extracellular solute-binding protein [Lederbergia galactosidilytica]|uniref:Sugar ABC transporter substrate-binding protein n=1 Tax=Lederbergia galactosidilytica TaxID=217031 RepID=A0A177ZQL6_9BACI|nr:extracellular solute-binding protein [Lederbergia galactosidilytica]KRG13016.1 sugar ABC transporter substrate-binding protein [Virgibacillus soli]MBP1917081.1 ABC-type glycerol-3-phosphate transport system substrate-binding protein [Lederbergia galactosidilytica]OAK70135.1 sugar ABC transporter substrate-binding protein [Lederbergia galactosidilytica]